MKRRKKFFGKGHLKKTHVRLFLLLVLVLAIAAYLFFFTDKFKNQADSCLSVITECSPATSVCNCGGKLSAPSYNKGNGKFYCYMGACQLKSLSNTNTNNSNTNKSNTNTNSTIVPCTKDTTCIVGGSVGKTVLKGGKYYCDGGFCVASTTCKINNAPLQSQISSLMSAIVLETPKTGPTYDQAVTQISNNIKNIGVMPYKINQKDSDELTYNMKYGRTFPKALADRTAGNYFKDTLNSAFEPGESYLYNRFLAARDIVSLKLTKEKDTTASASSSGATKTLGGYLYQSFSLYPTFNGKDINAVVEYNVSLKKAELSATDFKFSYNCPSSGISDLIDGHLTGKFLTTVRYTIKSKSTSKVLYEGSVEWVDDRTADSRLGLDLNMKW